MSDVLSWLGQQGWFYPLILIIIALIIATIGFVILVALPGAFGGLVVKMLEKADKWLDLYKFLGRKLLAVARLKYRKRYFGFKALRYSLYLPYVYTPFFMLLGAAFGGNIIIDGQSLFEGSGWFKFRG